MASPTAATKSIQFPDKAPTAGARYAKQEITEAIKFLDLAAQCTSPHLASCRNETSMSGWHPVPPRDSKIRNLLAWAKKTRVNKSVQITHQQPPPSRALTQQQRLAWLRELINGDPTHWPTVSPESFCSCSASP